MRIVLGILSGLLGMLAGWFGLAFLVVGLAGPDRDGGVAMGAFFNIGPFGGVVGFIAGVLLFARIGITREKPRLPAQGPPDAVLDHPAKPAPTRISRPFAFVILATAGVLAFWAWYELIRSPYLTHGAEAEMTLSMQFRLPPGLTLPEDADDLELVVDDGDEHASAYYGEKWFGAGKWHVLEGDRQVLLASAELNKISYWRKVRLRLPNIPEQVWSLGLDADPYPIPEYTPWRGANGAPGSKIEMRFRLTADRCAVCAFRNER
jgi:hypothetical protein